MHLANSNVTITQSIHERGRCRCTATHAELNISVTDREEASHTIHAIRDHRQRVNLASIPSECRAAHSSHSHVAYCALMVWCRIFGWWLPPKLELRRIGGALCHPMGWAIALGIDIAVEGEPYVHCHVRNVETSREKSRLRWRSMAAGSPQTTASKHSTSLPWLLFRLRRACSCSRASSGCRQTTSHSIALK